jgi:signal transduction histidine kinase
MKNIFATWFYKIQKPPTTNNDLLELDSVIVPIGKTMSWVRVLVLGVVALFLFFRLEIDLFVYDPAALLFIFSIYLLFGFSSLFIASAKMSKKQRAVFRALQLIFDILFITLIVYFSGGIYGRLAFLYILPVMSAASVSTRALSVTTTVSLLFYFGLIYAMEVGLVKQPNISFLSVDYFSDMQLLRQVLIIFIVAVASNFYIKNLKKQNEKILKLKDEFLFVILHDVRSPATAIRWLIEKYRKPDFAKRYPEIQEDVLAIERLVGRIHTVSESILLLAKNQHVPVAVEPLNVIPIITDILKETEPGIAKKHIAIEHRLPQNLPLVSANADFLKEALINVLSNAIKYNKNGGKIAIYYHVEGDRLRISVLNTGPRIEPEDAKNLFYPYERGSMEKKISGTGLGLYITRKIIEKMGGKIGTESSSDKETIFYVLLPLASISPKR